MSKLRTQVNEILNRIREGAPAGVNGIEFWRTVDEDIAAVPDYPVRQGIEQYKSQIGLARTDQAMLENERLRGKHSDPNSPEFARYEARIAGRKRLWGQLARAAKQFAMDRLDDIEDGEDIIP